MGWDAETSSCGQSIAVVEPRFRRSWGHEVLPSTLGDANQAPFAYPSRSKSTNRTSLDGTDT